MRNSITTALLLLVPILAFADRYGIDEAISEGGPIPSWLLPLAFVVLLIYHLHDHSKLDGQRVLESYEHEQTARKLFEVRSDLAAAKRELDKATKKYDGLHAGAQSYFKGLTTDKEFASALEPHLDSIEHTAYKAP